MSEFTERTYYDPYSRTQKPVLTDEEVKRMWPYKEAKHKRTMMDDAMPNLAPADKQAMEEIEGSFQRKRWRGVNMFSSKEVAEGAAQMELFPIAEDIAKAMEDNVASATARGVNGDAVVLPNHYARFKIEPIRFLVENFGAPILVGKIVKYSLRYDAKNGMEDLRKARRCMDMLIKYVEGDPDWWKADR